MLELLCFNPLRADSLVPAAMTEQQPPPTIPLRQLSVNAILPVSLLDALHRGGICPFTCQQLHKLGDQIEALRQLGLRLKVRQHPNCFP